MLTLKIIAIGILLIFLILLPLDIINSRKNFAIKKIKNNCVVTLKVLPDLIDYIDYDDLPDFLDSEHIYTLLNPFVILTKNSTQPKRYTLTVPFLYYNQYNHSVQLHYYSTSYWLNDVENIKSVIKHGVKNNYKLTTAQQLAHIIQEHLQIKAEIEELRQQDIKISNVAKLVAGSDIYNEQLYMYEIALSKIRNCLKQAEQLHQLYTRLVKEMLIGIKVAEEKFEHLPDRETSFDLQYQQIQEEYNFMKDKVSAYYQLLKDSRNIQV